MHKIPIQKLFAFIIRDFLNEKSYKLAFFIQFFGIFLSLFTFFFISKLLNYKQIPQLQPYGGDYFTFVFIGIAFFTYLDVSVQGLAHNIREGQTLGTLEALLVTQTSIPTILLGSSLYSFIWATLKTTVCLLLGIFWFNINFSHANLPGTIIILLLTILSFSSVGIITASFIIVFKKGESISLIFISLCRLLGGLYYPISVLPPEVQLFSHLLPVTYSLEGFRLALLKGHSIVELITNITALTLFSLVMLPLSLWIFTKAINQAKKDGTLTQY